MSELLNNHSPYLHKKRPILINNWEATYFDFNTEKLLDIAREAKKDGIEMLVMDDGWFGKRNDDNSSLGDWFVNEEKLWQNLEAFLKAVIPVAEEDGVNMAIHPDDPPWGMFGLPRIITNEKNIRRFLHVLTSKNLVPLFRALVFPFAAIQDSDSTLKH